MACISHKVTNSGQLDLKMAGEKDAAPSKAETCDDDDHNGNSRSNILQLLYNYYTTTTTTTTTTTKNAVVVLVNPPGIMSTDLLLCFWGSQVWGTENDCLIFEKNQERKRKEKKGKARKSKEEKGKGNEKRKEKKNNPFLIIQSSGDPLFKILPSLRGGD